MSADLENSAAGLEKVSFHSNPKERQCQRMLTLPHNCTQLWTELGSVHRYIKIITLEIEKIEIIGN